MKNLKNTRLTITISQEAYRRVGELSPNTKQSETIRLILEAITAYNGNLYDLLHRITAKS